MERLSLEHQGRTRTWTAVEGDPDTLLLVLHGSRQSGNVMRSFTDRTFETLGATVAYPDGVEHHFNDLRTGFNETARSLNIDDVGFLRKVIAHHAPRRVIGIGFSNGGQMVMRLLFDAPGLLDGAATFGASMPVESNTCVGTSDYQPTPLVSVQGTADPLVPYNGGEAGIGGNNRGQTRSAINSAQFFAELNSCGWRGVVDKRCPAYRRLARPRPRPPHHHRRLRPHGAGSQNARRAAWARHRRDHRR